MKSKISFFGKRYYLLTIVVCFVFIYLLFTEVYDRYSNTWTLYQALREKEASVLDPVHLEQKKSVLTEERDSLSSRILKERSSYQQNEIGVIQSISDNARKDQVTIESVDPGKLRQTGEFQELDFGVSVSAKFSQLGLFINGLENATIPFDLTKVQIISNPIGEGNLQVNIQAKAFLYHGVH